MIGSFFFLFTFLFFFNNLLSYLQNKGKERKDKTKEKPKVNQFQIRRLKNKKKLLMKLSEVNAMDSWIICL